MDVRIDHTTQYVYSEPNRHSVQYLRLTPQDSPGQTVYSWNISAPGILTPWRDAFGNVVHTLVLDSPHDTISIKVAGHVRSWPLDQTTFNGPGIDEGIFYRQSTSLTEMDEPLEKFVHVHAETIHQNPRSGLTALSRDLHRSVTYEPGHTHALTTAREAFAARRGVCQDHSHIFLACVRSLGLPARYVSGYLCANQYGQPEEASHAWVDVLIPGQGWSGFDVANDMPTGEQHIRLAVGRDYLDAAPVRGVRFGVGEEDMEVQVRVQPRQIDQ